MACWVCGSEKMTRWRDGVAAISPNDLKITDMRYGLTLPLFRCPVCGFVSVGSDIVAGGGGGDMKIVELYAKLEDREYIDSASQRERQFVKLLKQTKRFLPGNAVLDVGAGNGLFVKQLRNRGYDACGLEPSRFLAMEARANGIPVANSAVPEYPVNTFDAIYMTDVIEHIVDPLPVLKQYVDCLKAGGVLIITTPDIGSILARLMGKRWWHFRIAHVGYYNKRTLKKLAGKCGLIPVRTLTPIWYFSVAYAFERQGQYVSFLRGLKCPQWFNGWYIPIVFGDSILTVYRKGCC